MIPQLSRTKSPRLGTCSAASDGREGRRSQRNTRESNVTRSQSRVNTGPSMTYTKRPQIPESRDMPASSKGWAIPCLLSRFGNSDAVCYLKCRNRLRPHSLGRAAHSTLGEESEIERAHPKSTSVEDRSRRRATSGQSGEVWRRNGV